MGGSKLPGIAVFKQDVREPLTGAVEGTGLQMPGPSEALEYSIRKEGGLLFSGSWLSSD